MGSNAWAPAEEALAEEWFSQGKDAQQVCDLFAAKGIRRTHQSIRRKKQREGWHALIQDAPARLMPPEPLIFESDAVLGLFDPHAPGHDAAWMNRVMAVALGMGVRDLVIGGDLIDWASLSPYGRQRGLEASDEIAAVQQIVRACARNFTRIFEIDGNHEQRGERATNGAISTKTLADLWIRDKNVVHSTYKWCEFVSGGQRWRFVHPNNYSRVPGAVARDLAEIYSVNVAIGHGHTWGQTISKDNRYWAIDGGVCCDESKIQYKEMSMSRNAKWYRGAVLVIEGTPILLGPDNIGLYERIVA